MSENIIWAIQKRLGAMENQQKVPHPSILLCPQVLLTEHTCQIASVFPFTLFARNNDECYVVSRVKKEVSSPQGWTFLSFARFLFPFFLTGGGRRFFACNQTRLPVSHCLIRNTWLFLKNMVLFVHLVKIGTECTFSLLVFNSATRLLCYYVVSPWLKVVL